MDLYCSLLDYLNKEIVTKTPLQKEIIWMENISGLLRFRWRIHFLIVFYGIHPQYWICVTFLINSYVHAVLSIRNQIIFCERLSRFNLQRTVFWDYQHLEINLQFHVIYQSEKIICGTDLNVSIIRYSLEEPPDGQAGIRLSNGSWTGTIGQVLNEVSVL